MGKTSCNENVVVEVSFTTSLKKFLIGEFNLGNIVGKELKNEKYWVKVEKELEQYHFTNEFLVFIKEKINKFFGCDVDLAYIDYDKNESLEADEIAITIPVEINIKGLSNQFLLEYGYLRVGK